MVRQTILRTVLVLGSAMAVGCGDDDGSTGPGEQRYSTVEERAFAVAESSLAMVATFVGAITIRDGPADSVRVTATRWAAREEDLSEIDVDMSLQGNVVRVAGTNPSDQRDVSVDFRLTVPPDAELELATAVGSVDVHGRPAGTWRIGSGVGAIEVALPEDVNVTVELGTGVGSIDVEFPVRGEVSRQRVVGIIGTGADGEVIAECGVGHISLVRR